MDGTGLVAEPTEQAYRNGTGREKERKRKGSGGGGWPTVKARRKGGREEDLYAAEKKVPRLSVVCPALLPAVVLRFWGKRRRKDAASDAVNQRELPHLHKSCPTRRVRDHGGERTGRGGGASAHRVGGAAAQMQHGKSIIA